MNLSAAVGFKEAIDFDLLVEYVGSLGKPLPDGTGVQVSQVEAVDDKNRYLPDLNNGEFSGKTIEDGTGISAGSSNHATGMARHFYGNTTSLAPGITDVVVYESDDYLDDVLDVNGRNPTPQPFNVQNHSWIGGLSSNSLNAQALQRFDYTIDMQEMTAVIGVDNNDTPETPKDHPFLMTQSYNAIGVGRADGRHSVGGTTLPNYGPNRVKPDVVAPMFSTSLATAVTSSLAALLHSSGAGTEAVRTEPMKAIILAGATKNDLPSWSGTTDNTLDPVYGAGQVNAFNSYRIQQGGQFEASTSAPTAPVGDFGWDYGEGDSSSPLYYTLEIPEFHTGLELSVALAWNIKVEDKNNGSGFSPMTSLANFDLHLFDSSDTFLGTQLAASDSSIDNVEHLYLTDLDPGTYTLRVSRLEAGDPRDFGLSWRLTALPAARDLGDYNGDGKVDAADFTVWRNTTGSKFDLRADGDLNGVVNEQDYLIWKQGFGTYAGLASGTASSVNSIPEPASWLLLLGPIVGSLLSRMRIQDRLGPPSTELVQRRKRAALCGLVLFPRNLATDRNLSTTNLSATLWGEP